MGAEADEVRKILLKGNARTDADQARLGTLVMALTKKNNSVKAAAQQRGDAGTENVTDIIAADLAKILPDANKANIEKENPNNKRDIAGEEAKRRVSESEQITINAISTIATLLGDKIVKAIVALGAVIAGLMIFNVIKGAGAGIMAFIVGLFAGIKSGILRGIAFVFGGAAAGGGIVAFILKGIAKLFGPAVIAIGIFRGLSEIWDDPRTNASLAEKLSGGLSSMFAALISTAISAITLGAVNLDIKKVKKVIEDKLFGTIGDIVLIVTHGIGSIFFAIAKAIIGGYKLLFNTIIDGIDSKWMPDALRKRLQSMKFAGNALDVNLGDGGGTANLFNRLFLSVDDALVNLNKDGSSCTGFVSHCT
jgi:hypothetical protein